MVKCEAVVHSLRIWWVWKLLTETYSPNWIGGMSKKFNKSKMTSGTVGPPKTIGHPPGWANLRCHMARGWFGHALPWWQQLPALAWWGLRIDPFSREAWTMAWARNRIPRIGSKERLQETSKFDWEKHWFPDGPSQKSSDQLFYFCAIRWQHLWNCGCQGVNLFTKWQSEGQGGERRDLGLPVPGCLYLQL